MNDVTMQAIIWVAAGFILIIYMKRRRNRKIQP
jgi:hypothetical protein